MKNAFAVLQSGSSLVIAYLKFTLFMLVLVEFYELIRRGDWAGPLFWIGICLVALFITVVVDELLLWCKFGLSVNSNAAINAGTNSSPSDAAKSTHESLRQIEEVGIRLFRAGVTEYAAWSNALASQQGDWVSTYSRRLFDHVVGIMETEEYDRQRRNEDDEEDLELASDDVIPASAGYDPRKAEVFDGPHLDPSVEVLVRTVKDNGELAEEYWDGWTWIRGLAPDDIEVIHTSDFKYFGLAKDGVTPLVEDEI